jgi:disulfide bond formation protein DsbB
MTRARLIGLAGLGSAALLLAALGFQYLGGMAPCTLCIWQRWPHGLAIAAALAGLLAGGRLWPAAGGLAVTFGAGVAFYHTGVERGWWPGPDTCTSGPVAGLTPEQLMSQIMAAPLVRCDEVPWALFGLSMATWNGIASVVLVAVWVAALRAHASSSASQ